MILGSFPSVKSREQNFFYGHPQNRFWPLLARIFDAPVPATIDEKRALALANGVALWDVIASCEIDGSSDASIRNARPTDLSQILANTDIRQIYCNGSTSYGMYQKYQKTATGRDAIKLPSTSPANAAWSAGRLFDVWKQIRGV